MVQVIDADGHVMDQQYTDEISGYMPSRNARGQIFPVLDHMHQFYFTPTSRQTAGLCRGELDELLMREDLTDQDKHAPFFENARRFYPLAVARN